MVATHSSVIAMKEIEDTIKMAKGDYVYIPQLIR
jgi:hypothetical protein